jgi:hypothetical protein
MLAGLHHCVTHRYFLKAKSQMAHIYLHHRNNKRAFAKCYEELVEAYPSASSYMFLGEAYMNIQEVASIPKPTPRNIVDALIERWNWMKIKF